MDQELIALFEESLRRFNRERYAPAQVVAYAREAADHSPALWAEIAAMGWFELLRSEPAPAGGIAVAPLVPVLRAAGEGLWREPIGSVLGEAAVVAAAAAPDLREELLEGLATGTRPIAFAAREAGDGWRRAQPRTKARRAGATVELDGAKIAVTGLGVCSHYAVLAIEDGQPGWFLVARGAAGVRVETYPGGDGRPLANLYFQAAPALRLCSGQVTPRAEAWGGILAAAEAVGMMRGATTDTAEYLRQRKQFGKPLLSFQVLQHRLVEMYMLERETDALLEVTAEAYDDGAEDLGRRALALRAQASRALRQVTREAVQMHGGMGVTSELRIGHYYRRALMLDSLYGAEDWALGMLAAA